MVSGALHGYGRLVHSVYKIKNYHLACGQTIVFLPEFQCSIPLNLSRSQLQSLNTQRQMISCSWGNIVTHRQVDCCHPDNCHSRCHLQSKTSFERSDLPKTFFLSKNTYVSRGANPSLGNNGSWAVVSVG